MKSNALINRMEVILINSASFLMDGVYGIKAHIFRTADLPAPDFPGSSPDVTIQDQKAETQLSAKLLAFLNQALIPLLIWMVLGFAAGFLIGLFKSQ